MLRAKKNHSDTYVWLRCFVQRLWDNLEFRRGNYVAKKKKLPMSRHNRGSVASSEERRKEPRRLRDWEAQASSVTRKLTRGWAWEGGLI